MESLSVNGKEYNILKLLGKGKGGYSYLALNEKTKVVLKQIHHEPCDYYKFGNKIEAEINDYHRLKNIGIAIPEMLDVDVSGERIVKEYIDGKTVYEMVLNDELPAHCIEQVKKCVVYYIRQRPILITSLPISCYRTASCTILTMNVMITWTNGILKTGE